MSDADRILHGCVDALVRDKKYSTAKAAEDAIKPILELDALRPLDIPHTLPFVMDGLKYRAKNYAGLPDGDKSLGQHDFARIDSTFGRLIHAPVALDEAPGTRRLPPIQMTLTELLKHIDLKDLKASQTRAGAELLRRFIDAHPDWETNPEMTLGEILRRDLDETNVA